MAGRRGASARIAEAAVYVSMAGRRVGARSVEATVYVSMAGRRQCKEWRQSM
jgi:hypothetical protein